MTKKNMFRIGAVLMVCVMLLSSFSFAAMNGMGFSFSAGSTSCNASTSHETEKCFVSMTGEYREYTNEYGASTSFAVRDESEDTSYPGEKSASVSVIYSVAEWAYVDSTHNAGSDWYYGYDSYNC